MTTAVPLIGEDLRKRRILDAALLTFIRFGFRKTSMEEVARAAHLSRQGLYLHYATKEDLFRATVQFALENGIEAATSSLRDAKRSLEDKLVGGFDEWIGRYVGMFGADVSDIQEASEQLVGTMFADHETLFVDSVTKTIRASDLPGAYKSVGVTARDLADTLHATARGFKHSCKTRAEFGTRMRVAVRAMCATLNTRK